MKIIGKVKPNVKVLDNSFANNLSVHSGIYGLSLPATFDKTGNFIVLGMNGNDFARLLPETNMVLNFHIWSPVKFTPRSHSTASYVLDKVKASEIILSSSQYGRRTLELLRLDSLMQHDINDNTEKNIFVASCDDLSSYSHPGDMIYSSRMKSSNEKEFDRLLKYIDNNTPVLFDWADYDKRHTSRLLSVAEDRTVTNKILLLTNNPPRALRTYGNK